MTTSTSAIIDTSWSDVEHMSAAIQRAADGEAWTDVLTLSAARHNRIVQHFEWFPVGPDNAEFYRQRLSTMLSNEQTLQQLVREARKSLMRDGLTMQHNYQAVGSYINNSL